MDKLGVWALLFLGLVILVSLCILLRKPLKVVLKLALNSILGSALLILLNTLGAEYGLVMGVNPYTALFVGIFGLPGVVTLYVVKLLLK